MNKTLCLVLGLGMFVGGGGQGCRAMAGSVDDGSIEESVQSSPIQALVTDFKAADNLHILNFILGDLVKMGDAVSQNANFDDVVSFHS